MYKLVEIEIGQSIWDIAIQEYGSIYEVFKLIEDNENLKSIDSPMPVGQTVNIQENPTVNDIKLMEFFRLNKIKVNTGNLGEQPEQPGGIGFMKVGSTFKIT